VHLTDTGSRSKKSRIDLFKGAAPRLDMVSDEIAKVRSQILPRRRLLRVGRARGRLLRHQEGELLAVYHPSDNVDTKESPHFFRSKLVGQTDRIMVARIVVIGSARADLGMVDVDIEGEAVAEFVSKLEQQIEAVLTKHRPRIQQG
jgi:hypothetical protein